MNTNGGVKTRNCVTKCGDQLVYHPPLLWLCVIFPPFARKTGIITFRFIRRDIVFLNRCVPKETAETATSLLRKLGLENFYKVRRISFSFTIDQN